MTSAVYYAAALASAASWALGGVLWRRLGESVTPVGLNLARGAIGCLYLGVVLALAGTEPVALRSVGFLVVSGVLGISVADTLFLTALMQVGPRLTSLIGTLYPAAIGLSSVLFLHERLSVVAWSGIGTTMCGVALVLRERAPRDGIVRDKWAGVRNALLAMGCTTAGVLLAKVALVAAPPLEAAAIRLAAGVLGLVAVGCWNRRLRLWLEPLRDRRLLRRVALVVVVTVFGGFWLSLVALKHIDAAVAGTLASTSPLFVLPLSALILRERISFRALAGTLVAIGGVCLLLHG